MWFDRLNNWLDALPLWQEFLLAAGFGIGTVLVAVLIGFVIGAGVLYVAPR